jgi:molecular chaperone GrpE
MTDQERAPETPPPTAESEARPADSSEALTEENAKLADRLLRLQAEFDNYRKRSAKERAEWTDRAIEGLILDVLPVLDAFDRAIRSADEGAGPATVAEGIRLTRRLLDGALAARGLVPVEAVGKPFDAAVHEAAASQPATEGNPPGTVAAEILRGYRLGGRTIRPSRTIVTVAAAAPPAADPAPEEE